MVLTNTLNMDWAGRRWELRPERALVNHDSRTVVVADLHLGKTDRFALPGDPATELAGEVLDRLARVCEATAAESLVVLGGFFHARWCATPAVMEALARWRDRVSYLDIYNVRGGGEGFAGDLPGAGVEMWEGPVRDGDVTYAHEPVVREKGFVLAGRAHPAVAVGGGLAGQGKRARVPAFVFGERLALLPAFGSLSGMTAIRACGGDRVYAVVRGRVADVSVVAGRASAV